MHHFCGKCDILRARHRNAIQEYNENFNKVFQIDSKVKKTPYWYSSYVQAKLHQQLLDNKPYWIGTSISDSDNEYKKLINSKPTGSHKEEDVWKNFKEVRCELVPNDEMEILTDTNLPEIILPIRRSKSFPTLAPPRKIQNINIVLVNQPSPQKYDEKFADCDNSSPNLKSTVTNSAGDVISEDSLEKAEPKPKFASAFIEKRGVSPLVTECPIKSTIRGSVTSLTTDISFEMDNFLATSTPTTSVQVLNVIERELCGRRTSAQWIEKIKAVFRKTETLTDKKKSPIYPVGKTIKCNGKNNPNSSSLFSGIGKMFQKFTPMNSRDKNSLLLTRKAFLSVRTNRLSLDPQTLREMNKIYRK